MRKTNCSFLIKILLLFLVSTTLIMSAKSMGSDVLLEFYYAEGCDSCNSVKPIINDTMETYENRVVFQWIRVEDEADSVNYTYWKTYDFDFVPCVVVKNMTSGVFTPLKHGEIIKTRLYSLIDSYLQDNVSIVDQNQKPVAVGNGPYNAFINDTVEFNATGSFDPDGPFVMFEWDFGDRNKKNTMIASYKYQDSGNFTIKLKVTDSEGFISYYTTYAKIKPKNGDTTDNTTPGFELITTLFILLTFMFFIRRNKKS